MTDIRVDGVSVELDGDLALEDVDLELDHAELVALIGPNGAGKTTLLRCLTGAVEPDSGAVALDGRDVSEMSREAVARRVATLPQDTSVSFDFTVEQVVEMGRHPWTPRFGSDPDPGAVDTAMETADVERFAERSVADVSGGERQRVLLARCLAQQTDTLLLDEPTASLDLHREIEIMEMVRDLVDDGRAVVAALHDLDLAARYADRIALIDDGTLRRTGPPSEVLDSEVVEDAYGGRVSVDSMGLPRVDAFEERKAEATTHVHVVGNGARQIQVVEPLWRAGFRVTAGPVSRDDPYASALEALTDEVVFERPYRAVSDESRGRVRTLASPADAVVVAPSSVPKGFVPALDAVSDAGGLRLALPDDIGDEEEARCRRALDLRDEEGDAGFRQVFDGLLTQV